MDDESSNLKSQEMRVGGQVVAYVIPAAALDKLLEERREALETVSLLLSLSRQLMPAEQFIQLIRDAQRQSETHLLDVDLSPLLHDPGPSRETVLGRYLARSLSGSTSAPSPLADDASRVSPDDGSLIADLQWAEEQYRQHAWDQYRGQHVAVLNARFEDASDDVAALLDNVARRHPELPRDRIVLFFVDPGDSD